MAGTKQKKVDTGYDAPARLFFPNDETAQAWLSLLLDAYHLVDEGVAKAVAQEEKRGKMLACARGCSSCCRTHKTIPVYPLELVGMTWYATEKITAPERKTLKRQLENHEDADACPFLVDGVCSVHPMRPIACRQFNVFNTPCAEGEDPYYTRRHDVLTPIKKYVNDAFFIMLPFYGMEGKLQRRKAIDSGAVHKLARPMRSCNWTSLAEKMDAFDRKAAEGE